MFHYPQMQRFSAHDYTWDNKITTPPGLYFFSILVGLIGSIQQARIINILFNLGTFTILRISESPVKAWSVALFPVSFFFSFLYYTDSGSTFFVLTCIELAKSNLYWLSAFSGIVSMLFRQSNVIWIAFAAGCSVLTIITNLQNKKDKALMLDKASNLTIEKFNCTIRIIVRTLRLNFKYILGKTLPFLLAIGLFLLFILWNGSIVLGIIN